MHWFESTHKKASFTQGQKREEKISEGRIYNVGWINRINLTSNELNKCAGLASFQNQQSVHWGFWSESDLGSCLKQTPMTKCKNPPLVSALANERGSKYWQGYMEMIRSKHWRIQSIRKWKLIFGKISLSSSGEPTVSLCVTQQRPFILVCKC